MAKRTSKADSTLTALAIVIGIPILLIKSLVESLGWVTIIIASALLISLLIWYQQDKKRKKLEYLRSKYSDESVVQNIFQGVVWQGQSEAQLEDSLGLPVAIDRSNLKTKTRDVWKYDHRGSNRFGLRVTVENGHVIGWDKKA